MSISFKKHTMKKKIILLFILFLGLLFPAQEYYSTLRKKYWEYEENDARAFKYLDISISSAKKEKNYAELFQAYADAIRYSKDNKLKYADSAITAANLSKDTDLMGNAHIGKGAVYYFNYRKFQPALDEYLKAYKYTENAKDPFLKYENLYHIGVVKSYLGYYQEALEIFKECAAFFEPNTRANIHPNLIFNNQKGYLNSLHQMIICYQQLGNYKQAEKLTETGLKTVPKDSFFDIEKSYFYKCRGITDFNQKSYQNSINDFDLSLPELIKINDFTWASVAYFYRGLSYSKLGNEQKALADYEKVDSIFNKYKFLLPELRKNYEELITYYKKKDDPKQELYYTNQLLKADSIISTDFKSLSTRIHKEYDTKTLLEAKADLENTNFFSKYLLILSSVLILVLGSVIFYWFRRKKSVQLKYNELLFRLKNDIPKTDVELSEQFSERDSKLDEKLVKSLQICFAEFEKNKGFLEKGITTHKLAAQFGTNTAYLSQFINEFKKTNFNSFINQLRIEYATQKIYNDKEWRKYKVDEIALASGFNNRQSFSKAFSEYNEISPTDFLKKRKEDMGFKNHLITN